MSAMIKIFFIDQVCQKALSVGEIRLKSRQLLRAKIWKACGIIKIYGCQVWNVWNEI